MLNMGVVIPLALFAFVALIVALIETTRLNDLETEIRYRMGREEIEHRRSMQVLESELERVKHEI